VRRCVALRTDWLSRKIGTGEARLISLSIWRFKGESNIMKIIPQSLINTQFFPRVEPVNQLILCQLIKMLFSILNALTMKKIYLVTFFGFWFLVGFGQSQTITLTFLGEDAITHNNLPLESVYIQNATLGCDTVIYGENPSIVLTNSLGLDDPEYAGSKHFNVLPAIPNPFNGSAIVQIILNQEQKLQLSLLDSKGIAIAECEDDFPAGLHRFEVRSSMNGLLFLTVSNGSMVKSLKLISHCSGTGKNEINYVGFEDKILKASNAGSGFSFQLGNQLLFKSIKAGYFDVTIIDSPTQNSAYTFQLNAVIVIPSIITDTITEIGETTATGGGEVTSDGGSAVTGRGVCWSTTSNPTIADSYTTDGSGTGVFVSSLTGLTPYTLYYVRAYATNSIGTAYGNEVSFTTLPVVFTCGDSIIINHVAGSVAPVDKTATYGTVTNIPGEPSKCWITSNLGSDHQAYSKDDYTEASAGWYWQFNRTQGYKHDGTTRTPNTIWITPITENYDWQAANDPCAIELGSDWRIPTYTEWSNVYEAGDWINWNGPWNSDLKIHASGYLNYLTGELIDSGLTGDCWSSTQLNADNSWRVGIYWEGSSGISAHSKAYGISLRCLKE
jgi:hypothetical protein